MKTKPIDTAMFNDPKRWEPNPWAEYDAAASQLAQEGKKGEIGCPLPANMSVVAVALINDDPEAFQERVRLSAYALAMERTEVGDRGMEKDSQRIRKDMEQ